MLSLVCKDSVLGMFRGALSCRFKADWPKGACFVTSPATVCRHFNYHREFRPFFRFGHSLNWTLSQDTTKLIMLVYFFT